MVVDNVITRHRSKFARLGQRIKEKREESRMIGILYHGADLDGLASGAVVYHEMRKRGKNCLWRGIDYGDDMGNLPRHMRIRQGLKAADENHLKIEGEFETIYIVDFSLDPAILERLPAKNVVLIDHHESALKQYLQEYGPLGEKPGSNIDCIYEETETGKVLLVEGTTSNGIRLELRVDTSGPAACELAWRYFHERSFVPWLIDKLSAYDTWAFMDYPAKARDQVLAAQYGTRRLNPKIEDNNFWDVMLDSIGSNRPFYCEHRARIMAGGEAIWGYIQTTYRRAPRFVSEIGRGTNLQHRICFANAPGANSLLFYSIDEPDVQKSPVWGNFRVQGGLVRVTLFSNPEYGVKVNEIAEMYGGGGHPGAAGFEMSLQDWHDEFVNP
jgi:hypothetical protein